MANRPSQDRKFKGVTKDPLDLRDVMYEPSLDAIPFVIDNRDRISMFLDQGSEGACTGFGLAAVANFLLHNRPDTARPIESVSPRMLYEMAKRYDEWEGENYSGSSIRGAMKGWHKHGVCPEQDWPYVENRPGPLTARWQLSAPKRPLGAYFRVRHLHLNHMHSALNEVGILYASAGVHEGWYEVDSSTGKIPFRRTLVGAHAFAIVGYDEEGFWIQNSWGSHWGLKGCCHISYDDWLENGYDCWVARLGVPTVSTALDTRSIHDRVAEFDYIPPEDFVPATIRPHFVNLGNDGRLSASGLYTTNEEDVKAIFSGSLLGKANEWGGTTKLLLYAHGGLNDEKASAARIVSMLPYFLANRIYPLHFMWESGLTDTIRGIVQDAFRHGRFEGWLDSMRDRFHDLLDEGIELGARKLGRPFWNEMKENASGASVDRKGGAVLVANQIAAFAAAGNPVELHLVGHSAGSIFHAHLIRLLKELELPIKTATFYAPACTTKLFKSHMLPQLGNQIERLTIFNLTAKAERDDNVVGIYHKSLLHLVSGALERSREEPLLGMEASLEKDEPLRAELGERVVLGDTAAIHSVGGPAEIGLGSQSTSHGGFDNDEHTLNSTLRIILGSNKLTKSF